MNLKELQAAYQTLEKEIIDIRRSLWLRRKTTRNF